MGTSSSVYLRRAGSRRRRGQLARGPDCTGSSCEDQIAQPARARIRLHSQLARGLNWHRAARARTRSRRDRARSDRPVPSGRSALLTSRPRRRRGRPWPWRRRDLSALRLRDDPPSGVDATPKYAAPPRYDSCARTRRLAPRGVGVGASRVLALVASTAKRPVLACRREPADMLLVARVLSMRVGEGMSTLLLLCVASSIEVFDL